MMVTAHNARIEGVATKDQPSPYIDTATVAGGFAAAVKFYPQWSHVVLLRRPGDSGLVLAALPSERWIQDCRDDGYEVLPVNFLPMLVGVPFAPDAGEVAP